MNLAGQTLRFYVPEFVRRRALRELFESTAEAFGVSMPAPGDASAEELLNRYAAFTAEQATAALRSRSDLSVIRERLYASAYAVGRRLRHALGVTSTRDAMLAARAMYGMMRIDFVPSPEGDIRIPYCFFSWFYSSRVCKVMSALDQGLLAGLNGGGKLEFRQRITEGAAFCAATFRESPL
jgi:hypothetical protein